MSIVKEFKEFAVKSNVVDMAVGVIIGGAFGKIVSSFLADVVMPPIGMLTGGVDFSQLRFVLKPAEGTAAEVTVNYGKFITNVIDFTIVAFVIFMAIKGINAVKKAEPAPAPAAPAEKKCPQCAMTVPVAALRCGHCTSTLAGRPS
ncbi:MAG: large-conductance mechanosensitive channel protein MscL [Elusimicrobia bacterium]|nr:large-conductance mechanosensitive channel protein MscL [Elusimicrobiota bacterium]